MKGTDGRNQADRRRDPAAVNQALVEVGGGWSWVGRLYRLPPVAWLEDAVYGWVARHRATLARFWGDPPELS